MVGCQYCVVVLGPVTGIVSADHCDGLKLICAANCVVLSNTVDSELSVCLKNRPILTGDCRRIRFGPYCTFYPRLDVHLRSTGIGFSPNDSLRWKDPLVTNEKIHDHGESKLEKDYKCYSLCTPDEFEPFLVPFRDAKLSKEKTCKHMPLPIELEYIQALKKKKLNAKAMLKSIDSIPLQAEGKNDLDKEQVRLKRAGVHQTIQAAFRDWLVSTGNVRQVVDLVKLKSMLQ